MMKQQDASKRPAQQVTQAEEKKQNAKTQN